MVWVRDVSIDWPISGEPIIIPELSHVDICRSGFSLISGSWLAKIISQDQFDALDIGSKKSLIILLSYIMSQSNVSPANIFPVNDTYDAHDAYNQSLFSGARGERANTHATEINGFTIEHQMNNALRLVSTHMPTASLWINIWPTNQPFRSKFLTKKKWRTQIYFACVCLHGTPWHRLLNWDALLDFFMRIYIKTSNIVDTLVPCLMRKENILISEFHLELRHKALVINCYLIQKVCCGTLSLQTVTIGCALHFLLLNLL